MAFVTTGTIDLKLYQVEDHRSMMEHFRQAVMAQWGIKEAEYWDMIQESLLDCPKEHLWARLKLEDSLYKYGGRRMNSREWAVVPLMGKSVHLTPSGNPMKTYCGIRFASVSDYSVYTPSRDRYRPACKRCEEISERIKARQ